MQLLVFFVFMTLRGAQSVDCKAKLLVTTSGSDSTCQSPNRHFWPLSSPSDCHGWKATGGGRAHDNSANNIKCSADAKSFTYTQYPGVLDCSGTGNDKSYGPTCETGMPPSLHDMAIDLSCCSPDSKACNVSTPTVIDSGVSGLEIYLNGQQCDAEVVTGASAPKMDDWLQSGVYYSRNVTNEEKNLTIKLGMSNSDACDNIGERNELKLVVADTTNDVCQGWNHYTKPYPDTSEVHQNSAVAVQCVDGGITYAQYTDINCKSGSAHDKREYTSGCHQGMPPTVYTVIKDFSGCLKQGFKLSGDGKAYVLPSFVSV